MNQPVVFGADHPVRNRVMFTPLNFLLLSAALVSDHIYGFKAYLKDVWFKLYSRSEGKLTTSNFEHIFMGEVRNRTM